MKSVMGKSFLLFLAFAPALLFAGAARAAEGDVALPAPQKSGGPALLQALSDRRSDRAFADADLTPQQLSDLLWATAGVNRDNGLRVYPVAMGIQDTFVYVLDRQGVYRYDPAANALILIEKGDHRAETTFDAARTPFVAKAAVNLAYVHDASLWKDRKAPAERVAQWGFAHTGAVMQNAYLYAASQGWSAVVRGSFDGTRLAKLLKLPEGQSVTLVHSIGPRP